LILTFLEKRGVANRPQELCKIEFNDTFFQDVFYTKKHGLGYICALIDRYKLSR
jgi:hypothetical protein